MPQVRFEPTEQSGVVRFEPLPDIPAKRKVHFEPIEGASGPTLRFPAKTEISALPKPGFFGRIKEAIVGGARTGETLPGQAIQVLRGERPLMAVEPAPLVRFEAAIPSPETKAGAVGRGVLTAASEFTSPESLLLLIGIGGAMRVAGPILKRVIAAGFSVDMIRNLYKSEPAFRQAAEEGDEQKVWELLGQSIPTAAIAATAGISATRGATRLRAPLPEHPIIPSSIAPERPVAPIEAPTPIEALPLRPELREAAKPAIPGEGVVAPREPSTTEMEPAFAGPPNVPGATVAIPMPTVSTAAPAKPIVRRGEIVSSLASKLGELPIRIGILGKTKPGLLGFYKVGEEVVRTKEALDLPVIAHEVGHHVNKVLWGTGKGGTLNTRVLKPFSGELAPLSYDPKKPLLEGFPEFVRLYLTEPNTAKARAPKFFQFFEDELGKVEGLKDTLAEAQSQIQLYRQQPAVVKVLAHISKDAPAPVRNTWDRFYAHFVDQLTPIRRAVEGIAKKGAVPPTEQNAYELARLHAGWAGKADHFIRRGTFDPDTLKVTGKPLESILKPVEGRLDEFRAYLVSRRTLEKSAQGKKSGIDVADAQEVIDRLGKEPGFDAAAKEIYEYQDSLLQYLSKGGFLSTAQVAQIKRRNQEYVPFYRLFDDVWAKQSKQAKGKEFADLWSPIRRMKGSTREIIDPLESVVKNTYAFINAADRNRIAQALVNQAKTTEGAGKWVEPIPAGRKPTTFSLEEIKRNLEDAGIDIGGADLETIATVFRPNKPHGENVISVWQQGKQRYYEVHPELFRAMKALDTESSNMLIRLLSMPARALRLGATGLGPEFLIRNPIRDAMAAFHQSKYGFIPGLDSLRGLFHVVKRDDLYWEWKRAGGEHAALVSMDRTNLQRSLTDMLGFGGKLKEVGRLAAKGRPIQGFKVFHPIEALRTVSEALEAATRVGEFAKAKAAGETLKTAALAAREVTLDFARMGASTKALNSIVAFWNAQVQGMDKFARVHIENPRRAMITGIAGATIPSLLLYSINKDDPAYQELPRWLKDFFWLIPTEGTLLEKYTPYMPIPKPFEWGLVYSTPAERVAEWIHTKDSAAFSELLRNVTEGTLPSLIPQAAVPFVEAFSNRSTFTGRPIEPERMKRLPPEQRMLSWTTEFAKNTSAALGKIGIKVSPIMLEQNIYSWTGGLGRAITQGISEFAEPSVPSPTRGMADIPVARAFAVRWPSTQAESIQQFYNRLEELEQKQAGISAWRKDRSLPEPERMTPQEVRELRRLMEFNKGIRQIQKAIRTAESSRTMTPEEKRRQIDQLTERMINRAQTAIRKKKPGK